MKYLKQEKKSKWVPILCICGIALAILLAAMLLLNRDPEKEDPVQTKPAAEQTAPATTETAQDVIRHIIETPYAVLNFPEKWAEYLEVRIAEEAPYTVSFYAKLEGKPVQALFDIAFGEEVENSAGMLELEDGTLMPVGTGFHPFHPDESWSENEKDLILSMQEAMNDVLDQLALKEAAAEAKEDMVIDSSCVQLQYPGAWEKYLQVSRPESEIETIEFYGVLQDKEPVLLFTVNFGGAEGDISQVVTNSEGMKIKMNLVLADVTFDGSWSQKDMDTIYAMQEDANYLFDALKEG